MNKMILFSLTFSTIIYSANVNTCKDFNNLNQQCYYNASSAVSFAKSNALSADGTYFDDFTYDGGNCTMFISQALLAGLTGNENFKDIYNKRSSYFIDKGKDIYSQRWFYNYADSSRGDRGGAFTSAYIRT